jgi:hypothetical protein
MTHYLYGLMPAACAPAGRISEVEGLQRAPVAVCPVGDVAVIRSDHDGSEIRRTRRQMQAHTRVLERLVELGPVLPMRFGLVATTLDELAPLIRAAGDRIADEFARIDGQVEIGVRIGWPREAALARLLEAEPALARARDRLVGRGADAHFERIDLGRRVAEALDRRRTAAQHAIVPQIARLCTDHVLRVPESDVEAVRMECLLPAGAEGDLAAAAETAAASVDFAADAEPEIRLVGPLPPFNFVELSLWPDGEAA